MRGELSASAQRVQNTLDSLGFGHQVVEHTQTTRSAAEAAAAIGCEVGQIAKSLIFQGAQSGKPILIIVSGENRANEKAIKNKLGEKIVRPNPNFVREHTGFAIGGIPPVGHRKQINTYIDEHLLTYQEIWAAAGTPNAVFKLKPEELVSMTGGQIISVK